VPRHLTSERAGFYIPALIASTTLVSANTAYGQTDSDSQPTDSTPNSEIQEVTVRGVADKYRPDDQSSATGLQLQLIETPQAITVLTTEIMETLGASSVYDATDMVPGVQRGGQGFGIDRIMIRGLTGQPQRINGIAIQTIGSPDSSALERIEVVRGPATVVYGVTGAFGGELNSILKRPLDTLKTQLGFEAGSFDTQRYTADVTGPLNSSGTLKGRITGKYNTFGPPIDIPGVDIEQHQSHIMASLSWDMTDTSSLTFWYLRNDRDIDPYDGGALVLLPDGKLTLPSVDPDRWYYSLPEQSTQKTKEQLFFGEYQYHFSNDWRWRTQLVLQKWDNEISYFFPFGPFGAYSLGDDEIYIYSYDSASNGETLTFNTSLGGDFELFDRKHSFYLAFEGVDDPKAAENRLLNSQFMGIVRADQGGLRQFADGSPWLPIDRSALGIRSQSFGKDRQYKTSFSVLLNPTEKLQVLGGILHHKAEDETRATYTRGRPINPVIVDRTDWSKVVGRLGVTYDIAERGEILDDARIYVNYSEGFQPQTVTDANGNTIQAPREMEQYEVGIKTEFLNGAIGTALAVYTYEITNIPVSSAFLGSFGGFGTTVLEGKQKVTGVEAEIIGEMLPGWNLAANYTYMDSKLTDPNYAFTTQPRSSPKHSGSIISSYEFLQGPLKGFRFGGTVSASSDYSMVDGLLNINRFGALVDGAYTRVDLNASYKGGDGRYDVYLNLHNVFDEKILFGKQGHPGYGITYTDQRSVTFGMRYNFF
jgi:outer membrane receptor for ferric coprogen and ferric-rhodotorulic acid